MEHTDLSRLDLPEERTRLSDEQGGYSFTPICPECAILPGGD